MPENLSQMKALVDQLNAASRDYYSLGESRMSDAQWDQLYDELAQLEKELGTQLPDSPTLRVGRGTA